MEPETTPTHVTFAAAVRLHQAGNLDGAEVDYRRVLGVDPGHADALNLLGVIDHQRGRHAEAVARLGRAVALVPGRPDYHNNLGVALKGAGRLEEAVSAYREAVRLSPGYADARANLGVALHALARPEEAVAPLEEALRAYPDHIGALFALANVWSDAGQYGRALPLYRRAHELAPRRADVLNNLGIALREGGLVSEGLDAARRAVAVAPDDRDVLAMLGEALASQDLVEEAAAAYTAAGRVQPHEPHWPVRAAALCPAVFPDAAAIDRYRADLEAVLDAHRGGVSLTPWSAASGCRPSFNLAHHGRSDRAIKAKFAALFRNTFPAREPRPVDGQPRVGFVATRHHEGGFLRSTAGIVDRLDPKLFQVQVFGTAGGLPLLRTGIRRSDVEFIAMPNRLLDAADRIAKSGCDLLYHWQIGSDPLNYFLPFFRPATVQCTSWGTHVTSGIPAVDYYLSSDLIEPPGSEACYTEKLIRMATLPPYQHFIYRPDPQALRSEFGLPEGRRLYTCLQRLTKLHPDVDLLFAGILDRDRSGLILLLEDSARKATDRLQARLLARLPDLADRVVFLPRGSEASYLRLLSLSDVVLDPPHYGGGFSAYDAFGLGLPVVTLPGARHISRYALGCYRKMGISGLAVGSVDKYVDLACRLAWDRDYRDSVGEQIRSASPVLFEDPETVAEHERLFITALARRS